MLAFKQPATWYCDKKSNFEREYSAKIRRFGKLIAGEVKWWVCFAHEGDGQTPGSDLSLPVSAISLFVGRRRYRTPHPCDVINTPVSVTYFPSLRWWQILSTVLSVYFVFSDSLRGNFYPLVCNSALKRFFFVSICAKSNINTLIWFAKDQQVFLNTNSNLKPYLPRPSR